MKLAHVYSSEVMSPPILSDLCRLNLRAEYELFCACYSA